MRKGKLIRLVVKRTKKRLGTSGPLQEDGHLPSYGINPTGWCNPQTATTRTPRTTHDSIFPIILGKKKLMHFLWEQTKKKINKFMPTWHKWDVLAAPRPAHFISSPFLVSLLLLFASHVDTIKKIHVQRQFSLDESLPTTTCNDHDPVLLVLDCEEFLKELQVPAGVIHYLLPGTFVANVAMEMECYRMPQEFCLFDLQSFNDCVLHDEETMCSLWEREREEKKQTVHILYRSILRTNRKIYGNRI